ncbi:membrane protein [Microbacterium kribbense]|uniref:Membrane protein n=1 Tax=Microbacterium kribbense TaxID=433645 RepID=A0ABP7GAP9_9MICO
MSTRAPSSRMTGIGRVLVVVYGILALGATGRSLVQIIERFHHAPLAFTLSAVSAVVYILATIALVLASRHPLWYRVAWVAISFELVGVLAIGTLSLVRPDLFPEPTVWSFFGIGYVFIPLVLPFFGLWWLITHRPAVVQAADADSPAVTTR